MNIVKRMEKVARGKKDEKERKIKDRCSYPVNRPVFGDVGLELELEGENLPRHLAYASSQTQTLWMDHDDGSLRGENNEYVTSKPILIDELREMLNELWKTFEARGTKLKISNRCSTHVHVNVGTMTPPMVTSYLILFSMLEEVVTNWCGKERVSNPFALRVVDSAASLERWQGYIEGEDVDFDRNLKYSAMNIRPVFEQGSLEFRHMRGSDKPEIIYEWVHLLWALRQEAATTYKNPITIAQQVSGGGVENVIQDVIAKYGLEHTWDDIIAAQPDPASIPHKLRQGFLAAQSLLFCVDWGMMDVQDEIRADKPINKEKAPKMNVMPAINWEPMPEPFAPNAFHAVEENDRG